MRKNDIRTDVKKIGWEDVNWDRLTQDSGHVNDSPSSVICWEFLSKMISTW
jgi:hypothetical protein